MMVGHDGVESKFVFWNLLRFGPGMKIPVMFIFFDVYLNSLHKRDHFLLSFVVLIDSPVSNLEGYETISVKRNSQYLAFASYVRLVNLCSLLFAKLCDFQQCLSCCEVAVDYHAKELCQVSFALVPMLYRSDVLLAHCRGLILFQL